MRRRQTLHPQRPEPEPRARQVRTRVAHSIIPQLSSRDTSSRATHASFDDFLSPRSWGGGGKIASKCLAVKAGDWPTKVWLQDRKTFAGLSDTRDSLRRVSGALFLVSLASPEGLVVTARSLSLHHLVFISELFVCVSSQLLVFIALSSLIHQLS